MPRYLTPQQYRLMDEQVPGVAGLSDATLARYIMRAEASIDAFTGASLLTTNGFAPGTISMMQAGFDFTTRKIRMPLPVVPVRQVTRIRLHISNSGTGGGGLYADLLPAEVVINEWEGYMEVIALTLTYSMSAVIWELGLNPPIAELDMLCGFYLPYLGDTLYTTDNQNYRALRGFWTQTYQQATDIQPSVLPPTPPNVYLNGVLQSVSTYSVNYTEGIITFNSVQNGNPGVTADYTTTIPELILEACTEQTTYLLQQRALNQAGMGGLEQVKTGDQFARRAKSDDAEEDQLCAKARLKLAGYVPAAIA